jgi:hypothetical protein
LRQWSELRQTADCLLRTPFTDFQKSGFDGGPFFRDFENFNFFHLEILGTREKHLPVQSGDARITPAKPSAIVNACVAVMGSAEAMKVCAHVGITTDWPNLPFGLQRKPPRRDVVQILQRERKTFQTRSPLKQVILSSS